MYKRVLIALAEGFEDIEAVAAVDILTRAGTKVIISGMIVRPVRGAYGCTLIGDTTIDRIEGEFDGLIFPGGIACSLALASEPKVIELIKQHNDSKKLIAALNSSTAYLLAEAAGILRGKQVTGDPNLAAMIIKAGATFTDEPVVVDGNIITGMDTGASLMFALALVEYLEGREAKNRIAKDWSLSKTKYARESGKEIISR